MSKKSIILCISVAAVLVLGIAVAVFFLYRGVEQDSGSHIDSELLEAVPTDAAAVIVVSDYQKAARLLPPSMKLPDTLDVKKEFVVSLHNMGSLTPLFIFKSQDGTLQTESESQTLVASSRRHIEEGISILDNNLVAEAFQQVSDKNSIVFMNDYSSKLFNMYFGNEYSAYSKTVTGFSEVVGLNVKESSERRLSLQGDAFCGKSFAFFANVLKEQGQGEAKIVEALPSSVSFAASVQISDLEKYGDNYQKYLDNIHKLNSFNPSSLKWAEDIALKEVAVARWKMIDGQDAEALFVRSGKNVRGCDSVSVNQNAGMMTALFGPVFSIADDSYCISLGDWTASGSAVAMSDLLEAYTQQDKFDYSSPAVIVTYARGGFNIDRYYSQTSSKRKSSAYVPALVDVPKGPFKVRNCGTGKDNEFYQNANLYLCLRDENGKGLWGVTFTEPICGRVQNVDFFNNGKIQFLFAFGSKLHMIDRLGRFVSGFPVELGKDVLLGPDLYDFTGSKAYNIMVLHNDNTLEMYNLKGKKPEKWLGITCDETIIDLPELIKQNGKQYWLVTTPGGKYVFDFYGGSPLKGKEFNNLIK